MFDGRFVKRKGHLFSASVLSFTICAGLNATPSQAAEKQQLSLNAAAAVSERGLLPDFLSRFEIQVSGLVTDDTGTPLPGVTVVLKGTSLGVSTNSEGRFQLTVPDEQANGTLVFSFIGYARQEVQISGQDQINVTMVTDARALEEVVVVGYGTQRKSDVTGSVGVVSSEELLQAPVNNAIQGLQGRVAGVNVKLNSGSPTSSPRVVIRGVGTINASSNPLYVVDGVVMEDIRFLNPNDIESIEVLKDASSTAIYGARGANGVILVTTRRGALTEGIAVGYDGFVSIGKLRKKWIC